VIAKAKRVAHIEGIYDEAIKSARRLSRSRKVPKTIKFDGKRHQLFTMDMWVERLKAEQATIASLPVKGLAKAERVITDISDHFMEQEINLGIAKPVRSKRKLSPLFAPDPEAF